MEDDLAYDLHRSYLAPVDPSQRSALLCSSVRGACARVCVSLSVSAFVSVSASVSVLSLVYLCISYQPEFSICVSLLV